MSNYDHEGKEIVVRLRCLCGLDDGYYSDLDDIHKEAADKIERLEAALATCRELREYDRAEIERLKIERAEFETLMATRLKAATKRMENMRAILLEKRQ